MQQTSAVLIIIFREAQYLAHRHTAELKPELSPLDCQPHFCPLCHSALLFTLKRGLLGNNGRLALPTGVSWKPIASCIFPTFTEAVHMHTHLLMMIGTVLLGPLLRRFWVKSSLRTETVILAPLTQQAHRKSILC